MKNDSIQSNELVLMIVSIAVLVGFFIYMQNSSMEAEKMRVEKVYVQHCKSDSLLSIRINELNKRLKELEIIHAHKLKK